LSLTLMFKIIWWGKERATHHIMAPTPSGKCKLQTSNTENGKYPLKRNQIPSRYYNSITNLKFQHKPKYRLSNNPHIKIDLAISLGAKIP
jgi:hypothetical protein